MFCIPASWPQRVWFRVNENASSPIAPCYISLDICLMSSTPNLAPSTSFLGLSLLSVGQLSYFTPEVLRLWTDTSNSTLGNVGEFQSQMDPLLCPESPEWCLAFHKCMILFEQLGVSGIQFISVLFNWTQVSCTVGRFFTIWATRKAHTLQGKMQTDGSCLKGNF